MHRRITPADIPAGPLAGVTLNVWTVKTSGREHVEGCGRLRRSKPNVTRTITIPHDARLDYLWQRLPDTCGTCMKHHPYIGPVRELLDASDRFDDTFGPLWNSLDIELYNILLEGWGLHRLEEIPRELIPFRERLLADRDALIERWAGELTSPAARRDMLAHLFGHFNPPRPTRRWPVLPAGLEMTPEREARNAAALRSADAALADGRWTLVVHRGRLPSLSYHGWHVLTRQYWSASRSLDETLIALILPAGLVTYWTTHRQDEASSAPSITEVGPVPDALTSDDLCDAVLRCVPDFMFRRFGRAVHPQQRDLDLRPFLDQALRGQAPAPAAAPESSVHEHAHSPAVLADARGVLSELLSTLNMNIADWHAHPTYEDEEPNAEVLEHGQRARAAVEAAFADLSEFVSNMHIDDPLIAEAETYLRPILNDDGRIGGICLYPHGSAYEFLEREVPRRGEFRRFLRELMDALAMDWRAWRDLCTFHGSDARWPLPQRVWTLDGKPTGTSAPLPGHTRDAADATPPTS